MEMITAGIKDGGDSLRKIIQGVPAGGPAGIRRVLRVDLLCAGGAGREGLQKETSL